MDEIRRVKEGGGGTRYTDQPKHASQTWRLGDRHDKPLLHALPLSLYRRPFPSLTLDPQPLLTSSTPSPLRRGARPSRHLIQATLSHRIASRLDRPSPLPSFNITIHFIYLPFALRSFGVSCSGFRRFGGWASYVVRCE